MIQKDKLRDSFEKIYTALNDEQRSAVDTLYGPVMVIAGPGTGKTQILSARIGKILLDTDYQPDNILCLTYTDAGRVAMRKRLQTMIGADAYRVAIHTFHSFCNEVIQENSSAFPKPAMDPLSELERIDIIKHIIDGFKKDNPLKRYRGDVYFEISRLSSLFSTMKKEGWTSAEVSAKIDEYIADLPNREEYIAKRKTGNFNKGDVRVDKIEEEKKKMEILRAGVKAFDEFQALMQKRSRYDFDDMINWVINAFKNHPFLLAQYKEQYQFVLVDEYQDTSGTQNEMVNLLISGEEQPNVFVVGDDDQSIYRFQGANVENMLEFASQYSEWLKTVVLQTNYRSSQAILDMSRAVIENNLERLVRKLPSLKKVLTSGNPARNSLLNFPELHEYQNPFQEMTGITLKINQLLRQGAEPGSIAVIYRENKYGKELLKFFRVKQIPFYSKRKFNLFEVPLSKKIISILKYIKQETTVPYSGDGLLFEILHYNLFKVPPVEVARLSVRVAEKGYEQKTSMRQHIQDWINTKNPTLFDQSPHPSIMQITAKLEQWIADCYNTTIQHQLEKIIREGGFLHFALNDPEKIWQLEVLNALFDFVKEETHRNPDHTIETLVDVIELMEAEGLQIPLYQVSGSEKGVNLLTAHGSKGLEFKYVFMAGCNAESWEKKRKSSRDYKFPDTLVTTLEKETEKERDREELRRLFFVGITRAEEQLFISWSKQSATEKAMEPTAFIAEITDQIQMIPHEQQVSSDSIAEFLTITFTEDKAPELEEADKAMIDVLIGRFEMNVTALNNYLKCPLHFYYNSLLKVPSGRSEASEFGSAVHHGLEKLFTRMKADPEEAFPPIENFVNDFKWHMYRFRESFTPEGFKRRLEYGEEVLSNLYTHYQNVWKKFVVVERNFKNVVVDGVPLKGKLDKLEFEGNNVNVVDYKTGDPEKAKAKLLPPSAKEPDGGDYWRQAVFYKILVDNYHYKNWTVISSEFQFVEPNGDNEYITAKVVINPADVLTVREQIKRTWTSIQNREFYTGCGKPDCYWCNFAKENNLQIALHEIKDAEE